MAEEVPKSEEGIYNPDEHPSCHDGLTEVVEHDSENASPVRQDAFSAEQDTPTIAVQDRLTEEVEYDSESTTLCSSEDALNNSTEQDTHTIAVQASPSDVPTTAMASVQDESDLSDDYFSDKFKPGPVSKEQQKRQDAARAACVRRKATQQRHRERVRLESPKVYPDVTLCCGKWMLKQPRWDKDQFPWFNEAYVDQLRTLEVPPWWNGFVLHGDALRVCKVRPGTLDYIGAPCVGDGVSRENCDKFLRWRYYRRCAKNLPNSMPNVANVRDLFVSWKRFAGRQDAELDKAFKRFMRSRDGLLFSNHDVSLSSRIPCINNKFCPRCKPNSPRFDPRFINHIDFARIDEGTRKRILRIYRPWEAVSRAEFDALQCKVEALQSLSEQNECDICSQEESFEADVSARVGEMNSNINSLRDQISDMQDQLAAMNDRLDELDSQFTEHVEDGCVIDDDEDSDETHVRSVVVKMQAQIRHLNAQVNRLMGNKRRRPQHAEDEAKFE